MMRPRHVHSGIALQVCYLDALTAAGLCWTQTHAKL
jgi:hypothetical protein